MERKGAWITAGAVALTFATATLAVMANTGLLSVSPASSDVGTLTPNDLLAEQVSAPTTDAPVETIIRYEDVYVTVPVEPAPTAATVPAGESPAEPQGQVPPAGAVPVPTVPNITEAGAAPSAATNAPTMKQPPTPPAKSTTARSTTPKAKTAKSTKTKTSKTAKTTKPPVAASHDHDGDGGHEGDQDDD